MKGWVFGNMLSQLSIEHQATLIQNYIAFDFPPLTFLYLLLTLPLALCLLDGHCPGLHLP